MCGFILTTNTLKRIILSCKNDILHRGPDNQKFKFLKNYSLYHSRLKILDLKPRSNQPFTDEDKKFFLLFNGEIYNFLELKKKFQIVCKTSSDTEVLFILLKNFGIKKTLKEIKGMFSFAFVDVTKDKVYCARDHFGQKPFYYNLDENFNCSTNIKAVANLNRNLEFDKNCLDFYLNSSGILPLNRTIYKNIFSLPAGHYLIFDNKKKSIKLFEYFHPSDLISKRLNFELSKKSELDIKKNIKKEIFKAVENCCISDVKVGALLSGGIDSSLVTYFAKKINQRLITLTGLSKKIEKIPSKVVPKILKKLKIKNCIFIKHEPREYIEKLNNILMKSYSPSRWGGGIPMSNICKVARKNKIKVLLSGDSVDEICGGYKTFSKISMKSKCNFHSIIQVNKSKKNNLIFDYREYLIKNRERILKKLNFINSYKERKKQLFLIEDMHIFLQTCTLPHGDEYSMHESIELRNPFLELNLVKKLINLDIKYKSTINKKKNNGKLIFKSIAKEIFGDIIIQKKEGTRNYSITISNKNFWKIKNFKILKKYKIDETKIFDRKYLFKLINLEILYRNSIVKQPKFGFASILSKTGYKYFYGKK